MKNIVFALGVITFFAALIGLFVWSISSQDKVRTKYERDKACNELYARVSTPETLIFVQEFCKDSVK